MVKLPLWLNTETGVVIGANSRPNGFVKVVVVNVNGETIHSTLDALYRLITVDSSQHKISITDLEIKDTVIKSYGSPDNNKWWEQTLVDFPYINLSMDEHTILTISYNQTQADANGTQATTGNADNEEDETLPGGRGGGGGGGGDPITPPDKTPPSPPPITPPEEKDPYKDGKRKGDKLDDDKRSKMQELMDKVKGGDGGEPTTGGEGQEPGEGGQGNGEGEGDSGEQSNGGSGQGEGDGESGENGEQGQGDGDGEDDDSDSGDGDADRDEGLDPLEQAVQDAKDAKDEAKEAAKRADADEAQEAADKSQEAADEAIEIAEQVGDEEAEEMAEKAQDAADEAQEAADAAEELEEMIKEMFEEEENLDEEDFEEYKEGVLDSLNEEENNGVAVIMNFDGQYPMKIVMEDGTLTTSVSKYVNEHIKYGFVPSGFAIGYKGYVRADGENKGMIQFYNEDDKNVHGRSSWYITLIPSNVEIIGDDSHTPQDLDKSGREGVYTSNYGDRKRKGRKYVNWESGEIRIFVPEDKIGPNWLEVTKFFSGVYDSGSEIVVDRTIDGAAKLVNLLGGNTKNQTATSFTIVNGDSQITNLLNKMRMFMISGNEVSY
jgi:hypothetical protein